MKLYRIILTAAAISSALLPSPVSSAQENLIGEITITEEGDSVVTYKPKFFDFGPLNPGKPDMLKHLLENDPLASGKDMDALRKGAFERDLQTMHASAPRMRTMSAASAPAGLDKTLPVGKIPVQEGVTPTGARTYSIPITTAPALDFTPQISIVYNSQSGQGLAGYGWNISGLSAITITNKTQYYNGTAAPANYKDTDAVYSLDGMPLVKNSKAALSDEYQLETARGHVVVKKHISNGKVSHFTVLYPDGSRATFGQDGYSGELRYSYPITRIEDVRGHSIVFKYMPYQSSTGYRHYITSIEYGFDDKGTPAGKIQFSYSTDNLSYSRYYAGVETRFAYILKSISSYNGEDELCRYDLTHEQGRNDYILTTIGCTSDGKSLNPLKFSYGAYTSSGGKDDFRQKDQLILSSYFNTGDDVELIYKSGKFIEGASGDGMIAFPNFSTYNVIGYKKKGLKKQQPLYGSTYSADQKILIVPVLEGFSDVQSITAEDGFQYIEAVDTDADGTDEIVKVNFAGISGSSTILKITVYEFNQSRTLTVKTSFTVNVDGVVNCEDIAYSPAQRLYSFGDYSGNGKAQLMTTLYNSDLNGKTRTSFTALIDIYSRQKLSETHIIDLVRDTNEQYLLSLDIDNDGRTEMCWATSKGLDVYNLSGNSFTKTKTITTLSSAKFPKWDDKTHDMFITDINGDGYPDFIYRTASMYYAYRYTGDKYVSYPMSVVFPAEDDELMFYDINRDGLPDLIQRNGTRLYFFPNYKGTISAANKMTSSMSLSAKAKFLPCNVMDFNSLSNFAVIDGAYVYTYDFSQDIARDRLLTTFTDSHGKTTISEYEDMSVSYYVYTDNRNRTYGPGFGKKNFPMYLLYNTRTYTSPDISSAKQLASQYYRYHDAAYNWQGLGFCGFGKVETTDFMTVTNKEIITSVTYDPTAFGIATNVQQAFRMSQDSPFCTTDNSYSRISTTYGKLNPRLSSSTEKNTLTGVTTSTTYQYTVYDLPSSVTVKKSTNRIVNSGGFQIIGEATGNDAPAMSTDAVTPIDPGDPVKPIDPPIVKVTPDYIQEVTRYTYSNHVSKSRYLLGQVTLQEVTKTRPEVTAWIEKQEYEYDSSLMLPVKKTDYAGPSGNNRIQETVWEYDDRGRITSEKTARYNSTTYIGDTYTYDADGRYMASRTDALGRTETYSGYNKFGKPETVTDHKGRVTSVGYDEWGNEISRTYPEGTEETTVYSWGGTGLYTVTHSITGEPSEITHYDAADRELRSGTLRFDGSWLYTDRVYDSKGRLEKVSMPFKGESASLWNTYEYDEYNRNTKYTEASGNITSRTYSGWKISETRNGITTTKTLNPEGVPVEIQDNSGKIVYTFRADGQPSQAGRPGSGSLINIDKSSVQDEADTPQSGIGDIGDFRPLGTNEMMLFGYDGFGRRISISDPSAGRQTDTEVWAADGTSTITHTNPNGTIITYRDRFGRTVKTERKGEYTTTYTYSHDGLLTAETSTNGTSKTYTYDTFDRLSSEKETVPDGKWLRKDYTYTAGSKVSAIKYTSQSGEITTEFYTYANGHNTSVSTVDGHTVWAITQENSLGLPTKAMTGTVERTYSYTPYGQISGRTMGEVQDFAYSFSPQTGNLSSRTDRSRNKTESFGYDSLNRLTDNNGKSITYTESGNITSMESVGSFTYGGIAGPYQITSVSLTDGDAFQDREQTISYTCHSRPSRLNEGGRSASFTYNGSNDRVKMYVADGASAVLTRYYIGKQYEIDLTEGKTVERLYLNGDAYSSPMVLVKDGTAGWIPYNIGRDYLGSITHIATADGLPVAEYSYDAWGRLRNPQTHEVYLPGQEPELFLGRGFTGHEHLSWFGLINMNARLYDPVIGRFLSPDPYVQMPDFTQNFNRYSYGLNNPFVYIDENGEILGLIIVGAALIGGAINLAVNWENCNGFWEYLTAFGIGAAGGAAVAAAGPGGFLAVTGAGMLSNGIMSFTNNIIAQTGKNFDGIGNINWGEAWGNAAIGAASGLFSSAVGFGLGAHPIAINGVKNPVLSSLLVSPLSAGTGHVAGGTVRGLLQGKSFEEAIQDSFKGIGTSMALGGAIGLASTVAVSYANGINPWTGKNISQSAIDLNIAKNLDEQLALEEAMTSPGKLIIDHTKINDPRWYGWDKMQYIHTKFDGTKINIHYFQNPNTGEKAGFKFKY